MAQQNLLEITHRVYSRWSLGNYYPTLNNKVVQETRRIYSTPPWQEQINDFHELLSKTNLYNMKPNPTGSMVKASVRADRIPVFYISLPPFESNGVSESFRTIEGLMEQVGLALALMHKVERPYISLAEFMKQADIEDDGSTHIEVRIFTIEFVRAAIAKSIPSIWERNKDKFDLIVQNQLPQVQSTHIKKSATHKFQTMATYALKHGASADRLREILNQCIVKVTMEQ